MTSDSTDTGETIAATRWTMAQANGWMVEDIANTQGVRHAILCTTDGLLTAASDHLDRERAERFASAASGILAMGRPMAKDHGDGGNPSHVVYELSGAKLMFRGAGQHIYLGVVTEALINAGLIAHQMATTVQKLGETTLSTTERPR